MSQIVLELSTPNDLQLVLSFAKSHNFHVVAVRQAAETSPPSIADKLAAMRQAAADPLFLADIAEAAADFEHVDRETA